MEAAPTEGSVHPVFLSYARSSGREAAEGLHQALGGADGVSFLDSSDIDAGERIPAGLVEALLGARVMVVFVDRVYFSRWYCLREWDIALAAFDALVRRGAAQALRDAALHPIVIALPADGVGREELDGLPPAHRSTNWLSADDTSALADLVRRRLEAVIETIGERLSELGELGAIEATVVEQAAIPPPGNLAGATMYPPRRALDDSLGDGFVGRADELWRIHHRLWRMRGGASGAALTGAIEGGAGFGKTRLATEYFHRFGPQTYAGGLFWVNAEAPLEAQFHGILRELKPDETPRDLETLRQAGRDAEDELGDALHQVSPEQAVLYVVDNVPEPGPGESPSRLSTWCPGFGDVTLLATSRVRQAVAEPIIRFPIDVLTPAAAVALLTRELAEARSLEHGDWLRVADWVGYLPLALELLNAALGAGAIAPAQLLAKVAEEPVEELDEAAETLRELVPAGAVRGITEALRESYLRLRPEVQRAAHLVAQLAPDPIPLPLLEALEPDAASGRVKGTLVSRSFVTHVDSADERVSLFGRMHRVLADFLRAQSDEEKAELEEAAKAVVRVFYRNNVRDPAAWPLLDTCRPHAERLCQRLEAAGPDEDEIASLRQFLRVEQAFGSPMDDLFGLPPAQEAAHKNVSLRLELGFVLCDLLTAEGLWSAARPVYETAAALALAVFDAESAETLQARSGLGETLRELGEFQEARALQEKVLAVASRRFGENDSWTRSARDQLKRTLTDAGHIREALALQEQGASEDPGEREMHTRASTLFAAGDFAGARPLQVQVLEDARRLFGDDDRRTLVAMDNLAITLGELGERDAARELRMEAVAGFERLLPPEHDDLLKAKQNLGSTLLDDGRLEEARSILKEVLEAKRKLRGDKHHDTTNTAWSLFLTLDRLGEHEEAQGILDQYLFWLLDRDPLELGAKHRELQEQLVSRFYPDLLPALRSRTREA